MLRNLDIKPFFNEKRAFLGFTILLYLLYYLLSFTVLFIQPFFTGGAMAKAHISCEGSGLSIHSDICAAVLYFTQCQALSSDKAGLHSAFHLARGVFPVLEIFIFTKQCGFLFSQELDRAFNTLCVNGFIAIPNGNIVIQGRERSQIETKILPRFKESTLRQLRSVGKIVATQCAKK